MGQCADCRVFKHSATLPIFVANPDIGGDSVVFVFLISEVIALSLVFCRLVTLSCWAGPGAKNWLDRRFYWLSTHVVRIPFVKRLRPNSEHDVRRKTAIAERILRILSDELLVIGIAMLTAGFAMHCEITAHYFTVISDLGWLASGANLSGIDVLAPTLHDKPMARDIRVFFMVVMCGMMVAYQFLMSHTLWYQRGTFPAQCLFDQYPSRIGGLPLVWAILDTLILLLGYGWGVASMYGGIFDKSKKWLIDRPFQPLGVWIEDPKRSRWIKALVGGSMKAMVGFGAILMSNTAGLVKDAAWFIYGFYCLLSDRYRNINLKIGNQNKASFGQMLLAFFLIMLFFSFCDAYYENKSPDVKEPDLDTGLDDQASEDGNHSVELRPSEERQRAYKGG